MPEGCRSRHRLAVTIALLGLRTAASTSSTSWRRATSRQMRMSGRPATFTARSGSQSGSARGPLAASTAWKTIHRHSRRCPGVLCRASSESESSASSGLNSHQRVSAHIASLSARGRSSANASVDTSVPTLDPANLETSDPTWSRVIGPVISLNPRGTGYGSERALVPALAGRPVPILGHWQQHRLSHG